MLTKEDIQKQSERAYKQWANQWREHAKINAKWPMKPFSDFENIGIGRAVLCVANGYSLEEEIRTIEKHRENVDIIVCDKALGHLLSRGIRPTYVLVCDANVSYEKYLKPWENELSDSILISNACANPLWAEKGNWKDRYFFVVMDVLQSEKEFSAISGCQNIVAAGTNVSNALVIVLTQSDNTTRKNYFGYDKILLIGFDYSWRSNGGYYAFDWEGGGKRNYMRHAYLMNQKRETVYSSSNLIFSAKWLDQYIGAFKLPVVQCSKSGVFATTKQGVLEEQMRYSYRPEHRDRVRNLIRIRRLIVKQKRDIEQEIAGIAKEHYYSFQQSVS